MVRLRLMDVRRNSHRDHQGTGATHHTRNTMKNILTNPRSAALISLILALPLAILYSISAFEIEPFNSLLKSLFTGADGYRQNALGRIVLIGALLLLPAAFLINLLSMVTKAGSERATPFRLTPAHSIMGGSILFVVLMTWADMVLYELRPFVTRLGSGSTLGQILFSLDYWLCQWRFC